MSDTIDRAHHIHLILTLEIYENVITNLKQFLLLIIEIECLWSRKRKFFKVRYFYTFSRQNFLIFSQLGEGIQLEDKVF